MPTNFPYDPGGKSRFVDAMIRHVIAHLGRPVTMADRLRTDLQLDDRAIVHLGETMHRALIAGGETVRQIPPARYVSAETVLALIGELAEEPERRLERLAVEPTMILRSRASS